MRPGRAVGAGLVGTALMTMLMLAAPMMGLPPMRIGNMLGDFLGIGAAAGWGMHVMIGAMLALGYALLAARRLPGPAAARGMAFGVSVFLMAQLIVMPMMGAGVFSGGRIALIAGSLMGHLVYGGVVGAVYGGTPAHRVAIARAS